MARIDSRRPRWPLDAEANGSSELPAHSTLVFVRAERGRYTPGRSRMARPRYSNVHRQQLFHWIGSHIEAQLARGELTNAAREQYVDCLEGALRHGLWVQSPREPDELGRGLIRVRRAITCFTEWSLDLSRPHTTRYGRLGLGFPKLFVLQRGGQPVTYVRDLRRGDPYTAALVAIETAFQSGEVPGKSARQLETLRQHFDYLTHFSKRIRKQPRPHARRPKPAPAKKPRAMPRDASPFERRFGGCLHYLEEREWRIVHDEKLAKHFARGPKDGPPSYYVPFRTGEHLFTVVLPDNDTVSRALRRHKIRNALFPSDRPHATVLSLEDVNTF